MWKAPDDVACLTPSENLTLTLIVIVRYIYAVNVQANGVAPAGAPAGNVGLATGVRTVPAGSETAEAVIGRPVEDEQYVDTVRIVPGGAGSGEKTRGPGERTSGVTIFAIPLAVAEFP